MTITESVQAENTGSPIDYETLVGERNHTVAREAADYAREIVISRLGELPKEEQLIIHEHGRRVWTGIYSEILAMRQSGEMNDWSSEVPGVQAVVGTDNKSVLRNFLRQNPIYTRQVESIYAQYPLMAVVELPKGGWQQSLDGVTIYESALLSAHGKIATVVNPLEIEGLTVLRAYGGGGESYIKPLATE